MRRVAVTTSADAAEPVAAAAARFGLTPVLLPCIEVTPAPEHVLAEARREAKVADLMVITSARTVSLLWPERSMPPTPVGAVGDATAHAVEEAGGVVVATGTGGGEDLVRRLEVGGRRVLHPGAAGAAASTAAALTAAGAEIIEMAVYEVAPVGPGPDPVDAAMFGSPSAVFGWISRRSLDDLILGAIGSTTAAALRDLGATEVVVPLRPGVDLLARQLAERMRR